MVFHFINLSYFLFILPPSLLPVSCRLAFTTEQSLKFLWNIILTDHSSLLFYGIVVYFCLIYVFGGRESSINVKICSLSSFQSHPLAFTFYYYYFFFFKVSFWFSFFLYKQYPPSIKPFVPSIVASPTQKSKVWPLLKPALKSE